MSNTECTAFLQWALPRLNMRWKGFRKVRGQVCKRLKNRMGELGLKEFAEYRARLETDPQEWCVLDSCCHITISRFFRDRGIFDAIQKRLLPGIARRAKQERRAAFFWSAGCAAGEEAYTLRILWDIEVVRSCPGVSLSIVATDIDEVMIGRAREACFEQTSLRELPLHLVRQSFDQVGLLYCVRPQHREGIDFLQQDLRFEAPAPFFDLILCRYVAFTYFEVPLQRQVLARIAERLLPNGYLVIGTHEELPRDGSELTPLADAPQIFQKAAHEQ
ncbi:MAG TPA: CheR family methyltransferase [Methylocella sp.]|nr:CheR family methyltransferase [Methylocella sp.]